MDSQHLLGVLLPVALFILWSRWTKYFVHKPGPPTCFRVSGIPLHWESGRVMKVLQDIDPNFDPEGAELSGPFPDSSGYKQTAVLNLNECTSYFTSEPCRAKNEVIRENNQRVHLFLDNHFCDLTPLNRAEEPVKMDVIAITSLGGHAFGSWQSRTSTKRPVDRPMWLRDFLPQEFPNARIMTYGYNNGLKELNKLHMTDSRRSFIECLENCRRLCPKRPIVFIGHSLGGTLVVQTLIEAKKDARHKLLFESIKGVFLFGTPHQGLKLEQMVDVESDDQNLQIRNLLFQLNEGSEYLENQKEALCQLWERLHGKVVTFYETEPTKPIKTLPPGLFGQEMGGVQMVQRLSAQLQFPGEYSYPVRSNHTDLVKLDSPQDNTFQTVVTRMKACIGG